MSRKKLFLIGFALTHASLIWVFLSAASHSTAWSFLGVSASPWLIGSYALLTPVVSPVLWLHFNSTLQISVWVMLALGALNSFAWAWTAWQVVALYARRRANQLAHP